MGVIAERIADLARRCGDLSPIAPEVRAILVEGNKRRALAGVDFMGRPYAPLAPSTWRTRKGSGPPLAPRSAQSRVVTEYTVQVTAGPQRLTFVAGWPNVHFMEYHIHGTSRMPRRDPLGFADHELYRIRQLMAAYVMKGEKPTGGDTSGAAAVAFTPAPRPSLLGRAAAAALSLFKRPTRRLGLGRG